jgi:hypothetical protein
MRPAHRTTKGLVMTDPYTPGNRHEDPVHAADLLGTTSGQPSQSYSVPADSGCYEIRFRLTGLDAYAVIFGLVLIASGVFRPQWPLYERVIIVALGGLSALQVVIPIVSRKILFRADPTGITLGNRGRFGFPSPNVSIPWTDIKKIALYKITRRSGKFGQTGSFMIIVPRGGAHSRTRRIDTWRLDTERLAAVAAAAAPDVPVDDAGDVDPWVDADLKRLAAVLSSNPSSSADTRAGRRPIDAAVKPSAQPTLVRTQHPPHQRKRPVTWDFTDSRAVLVLSHCVS